MTLKSLGASPIFTLVTLIQQERVRRWRPEPPAEAGSNNAGILFVKLI